MSRKHAKNKIVLKRAGELHQNADAVVFMDSINDKIKHLSLSKLRTVVKMLKEGVRQYPDFMDGVKCLQIAEGQIALREISGKKHWR